MRDHIRSLAERTAQLERIKVVLRREPCLSRAQLLDRFHNCKDQIAEARRQLKEEGVVFPDPRSVKSISCYR